MIFDARRGVFVLIDPGMALDLADRSLTKVGYVVGTVPYLSPDQLNGPKRDLDFRSDLYSLGICAYEAVTGQHPYVKPGMALSNSLMTTLNTKPAPIRSFCAGISPAVEELILRMLEKEPHLRFRTVGGFSEAVERAAGGAS